MAGKVHDRLTRNVRALQPYRPLYHNLGDETGIAELSAFWDFDFSEPSLTAMRDWLKERYDSFDGAQSRVGLRVRSLGTGQADDNARGHAEAGSEFLALG